MHDLEKVEQTNCALAMYEGCTKQDLQQKLCSGPTSSDLNRWQLTEDEWLDAVAAALDEMIFQEEYGEYNEGKYNA